MNHSRKYVADAIKPILLVFALLLTSCSNRTVNGLRQGYWKETDTINGVVHTSQGRYRDGLPVRTWKYKADGKLVKREKYKGEDCFVEHLDINRKVTRSGMAKLSAGGNNLHWYYTGDWTTFDLFGRPIFVDTYYRGELVGEKEIIPNP